MKRRKLLAAAAGALLVAVCGAVALAKVADAPTDAAETPMFDRPVTAAAIARGAYIAREGDCAACHTVKGGRPYAGGYAQKLPFGTVYSSNITPDPDAGIGRWTDAQFIAAMYRGLSRDGRHLYPAMPYANYTKMPIDDVLALKAYLFSLKPVVTPAPKNDIAFPFNQTWGIAYWNLLFNPKQRFRADPGRSAELNRGAYLVEGPGHCGGCHTPRNLAYGEKSGRALAGAVVENLRAYNITSDPVHGIGSWSTDDLVRYFRTGRAQGRGVAGGSMALAVEDSLSHLTDADLKAIALYLKAVPARDGEVAQRPAGRPWPPSTGDEAGRRIYAGTCAGCHGWGRAADPLLDIGRYRSLADPDGHNAIAAILKGVDVKTAAGAVHMPAFGPALSDAETAALVRYLLGTPDGDDRITAERVRKQRE